MESEPVHTRIELHMYRKASHTVVPRRPDQRIQQAERIHFRLQTIVKQRLERRHLRIHHHNIRRDTVVPKRHAFISHRHRQIVHAVVLQRLCHLHGTRAIAVSLNHAHQFGRRMEERTVIVQIADQRTEVHFENRLVHFLHQQLRQLIKTERAGALQENHFVAKLRKLRSPD